MELLRGQVLCLVGEIGVGPRARHDERRPDSAELACEWFRYQRLVAGTAICARFAAAEHDLVVRVGTAGDVEGVDEIVAGQVSTDIAAAVDEAKEAGVDETLILKWTNMADLMRVKGVGEEYSELLEAAGVDTVKELRKRKPENLHQAMSDANARRKKNKLVRQLPGLAQVEKWVAHAKELPPMMSY